jgi:hypothetical protein
MPSDPEPRPALGAVLLRALLYAVLIALLVLYAPGEQHVFIYQGF